MNDKIPGFCSIQHDVPRSAISMNLAGGSTCGFLNPAVLPGNSTELPKDMLNYLKNLLNYLRIY